MTGLLLVALLLLVTLGVTAWSVKTRPRWTGNGLLVMAVAELLWIWLLVAAHGGEYPGPMWLTWGICHVLVVGAGVLTARWMGDSLPGADGRGWFHLSTVIAAALALSIGAGWVVTVFQARSRWGAGVDDTLIVLTFLGTLGVLVWAMALVGMLWFLRHIRRGRLRLPSDPGSVDAVVVLGAGLVGEEVSDLLAARCDRGAAAWRDVEKARGAGAARQVPLIVSGGQGPALQPVYPGRTQCGTPQDPGVYLRLPRDADRAGREDDAAERQRAFLRRGGTRCTDTEKGTPGVLSARVRRPDDLPAVRPGLTGSQKRPRSVRTRRRRRNRS